MNHQIILHQASNLPRLIIQERHVFLAHGRHDRTFHDVRSRYHIGRIRTVGKTVIGNCAKCKLLYATLASLITAPLPAHLLRPFSRPFAVTEIDYFSLMNIIMLRQSLKRWGVIFTCLTKRAVHIEMAESLTISPRFLAIRQRPRLPKHRVYRQWHQSGCQRKKLSLNYWGNSTKRRSDPN